MSTSDLEDDDNMWRLFEKTISAAPGSISSHSSRADDDEEGRLHQLTESSTTTPSCSHCRSIHVEMRDGNYVCVDCNTVVTRWIDSSPEWRVFGADNAKSSVDPSRCAPMVNACSESVKVGAVGSVSASTTAMGSGGGRGGRGGRGGGGGGGGGGLGRALHKLHLWNSMTHKERNLFHVFDAITCSTATHGIPACILEEAKALYKRVSEHRVTRGDNRKALIACSVYVACKLNGVPRSVREVAAMFSVETTAMTKACKQIQAVLDTNTMSSRPSDFLARFCSKLGLGAEVVELCKHVLHVTNEACLLPESTPPSMVAAVIVFCSGVLGVSTLTREQVAEVCQMSQVTVAKCVKRMNDHRDAIVPANLNEWLRARMPRKR